MKVNITIDAVETDGSDSCQSTDTLCGFFRQSDHSFELTYREPSGEEGLGNTLTALRVFDNKMELSRQGDYRCLLTMEVGCRHDADYDTPLGRFTLTTDTDAYCSTLTPDGRGELTVSYTLYAAGNSSHHRLHIIVTPA